jgi:isopropylmalate/homocitrate/citramalate synthase
MDDYAINPERRYYNFKGQLPPVTGEPTAAELPPPGPLTYPKLITDTTLRDGAQDPRFALFPNDAKLRYCDLLHQLDNDTGRIEAMEVFIYQKRDVWVLEKLLERGYDYPRITTWTRATPKDIKLLAEVSGGAIKETGMLASSSDHHIFDKMGIPSKEEAVQRYMAPILTACELGIRPRVHLEDVTKADVIGWVIPFMLRVLKATDGAARFRLCDTLGIGVPDPYAALPMGVPRLVSTIVQATGAELEFHGHSDLDYSVANSMAAFQYGCKRVNTAFAGLGERTGNAPLEAVLANYIRVYGDPGFNLEVLPEIAELIHRDVVPMAQNQPVIGHDIFTTQAGIHQTGLQRQQDAPGGLIYLPYDPALVGRRQVESSRIGSLSGMDGVAAILNQAAEAATGEKSKFSPASRVVKQIYDAVHQTYDGRYVEEEDRYIQERTTFFATEEILELARSFMATQGEN